MSKANEKRKPGKPIHRKATDYAAVLMGVLELLDAARRASARAENSLMTATCWQLGRRIVESEQGARSRRITERS